MMQVAGNHYTAIRWLKHWALTGALLSLVKRGGTWAGCGPVQSPHRCYKRNSPPINGRCTNLVALWLPLHCKGLIWPCWGLILVLCHMTAAALVVIEWPIGAAVSDSHWSTGFRHLRTSALEPLSSVSAVAGAITVHVSAKPKDTSDGRKITAVASQRRCDIAWLWRCL